jgi:hypothetical protein
LTLPLTRAARPAPNYLQELQDHFGYTVIGSNVEHAIGTRLSWLSGSRGTYDTDVVVIGKSNLDELNEQRRFLGCSFVPSTNLPFIYRVRAE